MKTKRKFLVFGSNLHSVTFHIWRDAQIVQ